MTPKHLPLVDEHAVTIDARPDEVWSALVTALDHGFARASSARYARVVGCAHTAASGPRPLSEGSTLPGFVVARSVPGRELLLEGTHRFSTYTLRFGVEPFDDGTSRLRAESRATFPGAAGTLYRALVIGSRGHVVLVRRLLNGIRRRAELASSTPHSMP